MKLFKTFSIFTAASFVNKGMMFSIIPFLTNVISPQQNGILSLYGIFVMFVIPFTLMGFSNSIMMEYVRLGKTEYRSFFSSSLLLSTLSFLFLMVLFLVFGRAISDMIGAPYHLLFFGLLYAYFNIFFEGILAYMRVINKPISFVRLSVIKNTVEIILIVWLVLSAKKGVDGKVYSALLASLGVFFYALYYFYRNDLLTTNIKRNYLFAELKFGVSQIFFQLNLFILASTDKFMIAHLLHDTPGLGIYFVANQFAFIINVLVTAFFLSYQPLLYNYLSNLTLENKYRIVRIKYIFAGFLLVSTILLSVTAPVFYNLFIQNKIYHQGIPYVAWNSFAFFFWGLYALFLGYLYFYRKNKIVIVFSIFSCLVCILTNYLLIKQFNVMGAAYADLLTCFILFITLAVTVKKYIKIDLPWFDFRGLLNFKHIIELKKVF